MNERGFSEMGSTIEYADSHLVKEKQFREDLLLKYESIMAQGNGYLEVRNSLEETYQSGSKGMFVAGVFNKYSEEEVTELANFPDVVSTMIKIDGETVKLTNGTMKNYSRTMDYSNGQTIRQFEWTGSKGVVAKFSFKRFVSMANKHLLANQISIEVDQMCVVEITSGIDGRITNSGSQHFEEGEKRFHQDKFLQLVTETSDTKIPISINCTHVLTKESKKNVFMKRRQLMETHQVSMSANTTLDFVKYTLVYTGRDKEYDANEMGYLKSASIEELSTIEEKTYDEHFNESKRAWEMLWNEAPITITAKEFQDQLLLNFARYHIHAMSPIHDARMNIGAKGMTGEGYKGHTFWDTEIFILPYFSYNYPESAKSLIHYRLKTLEAAEKNAKENGYKGAQYPWESAWITDGEVTPKFGGIDVVSGKPTPVLTGELEHHVTGDVVFGAHEYVSITGDESFKEELVEMAIQCAKFWSTRVKWQEEKNRYEIHQVIGPDEYTEHVDNNAYTNYLASYSLRLALQLMEEFPDRAKKMITSEEYDDLIAVNQALYLPKPNERGIIPQDDTFLSKEEIDLDKYHKATQVLTILNDYNMDQINDLQVLKQADVLLLLLLFPESFSQEIKQANWDYYYPRTLHDSSLSKSTHCNFALLLNDVDTAYKLFQSIFDIDLSGENMHSSDDGIHAASLGGVWQNVVLGFGGLRINKNGLSLAPKLPRNWDRLEYVIKFKKRKMTVTITHDQVEIREDSGEDHSEIELLFFDRKEVFKDKLTLKY